MKPIDKLRAWQPTAIDVRKAGKCDACHRNGLLFYGLPQYPERQRDWSDGSVHVDGGYYCPNCGFSNAGGMTLDRYENAERLEGDTSEQ